MTKIGTELNVHTIGIDTAKQYQQSKPGGTGGGGGGGPSKPSSPGSSGWSKFWKSLGF